MRRHAPALAPRGEERRALEARRFASFLARQRATLVVLSGDGVGMEHVLDQKRVLIGRGPGVDLALREHSLKRVHACIEFQGDGYRLRHLSDQELHGSAPAEGDPGQELKHEDRFTLGQVTFEYLIDDRSVPVPE